MDESRKSLTLQGKASIKKGRLPQLLCVAMFSAIFLMVAALTLQVGVSVQINGEAVGVLSGEDTLKTAVGTAEAEVTQILGEEQAPNWTVTSRPVVALKSQIMRADTLKSHLIASVESLSYAHAILFADQVIGAAATLPELEAVKNEVLASYLDDTVDKAEFTGEIQTVYGLFQSSLLVDRAGLYEIISQIPVRLTVTEIATLSYETEYVEDFSIYQGKSEIVTEGISGEGVIKVETTVKNGKILRITQETEEILRVPVSEIVAQGTKVRPAPVATGNFIWPANGTKTSEFGLRNPTIGSTDHRGIDICADYGSSIKAADGGKVIYAGWSSGYGYLLQIQHQNGYVTYYAHCSSLDVAEGELVEKGQHIAKMGATGTADGNHLHFEIRINGTAVDPLDHLP